MEKFLREWRQDAASRNQYETAIFVGDKVLALTNNDKDAIQLAHLHFSTGNYSRAQSLLTRQDLVSRNVESQYLASYCLIKQGRFDDALAVLGDRNPVHLIRTTEGGGRQKLARTDANGRSGPAKQSRPASKSQNRDRMHSEEMEENSHQRYQAAMCYLRGICYAKGNAFDRAKECYKAAVRIDVQCFEAFDQLMKNALMSPEEEWNFLEMLDFDSITVLDGTNSSSQQAAELTKMLYITRLSKYKNSHQFTTATETLATHYKLASNPDLMLAKAELLFTQCRFRESSAMTERILENDKYNFATLPIHLACLHELDEKNALFLLAHDFADRHPEEPATWLAVGVYYLTIGKIAEARRFFSKSSIMDPHFGPAWIGFAHTFAAEGEHDQAISAYSTAARLFQGTHLPQLFLGMQNLQLHNMPLALEYFNTAYSLCKTDPLLLNELGVVYFHQGEFGKAIDMFNTALQIAQEIESDPRAWLATRANLGHSYRRVQKFQDAVDEFDEVLRQGGRDAGIFAAKGLALLEMNEVQDAILALHESLTLAPQDPVANDLLSKALEQSMIATSYPDEADEEIAKIVDSTKMNAGASRKRAQRTAKEPHKERDGDVEMGSIDD